jgi:hypothetical protein
MTYKIIVFIVISCLTGLKKPIYGGLSGMIAAIVMSMIWNPFDLPTVVFLAPFGFGFGHILGLWARNLFHGSGYYKQKQKNYYMSMSANMGGGIIYTDEEEKNAKDNKRKIK